MRLLALVPCDEVHVNPQTRKFAVYARVECAPGKHVVQVSIRRQGQEDVLHMMAEVDVKCASETGMLNLSFGPVALTFKEEGRYVMEAFGDGELLGGAWFDVVKKAVLFLPAAGAGRNVPDSQSAQEVGRKNGAQIPTFDQVKR